MEGSATWVEDEVYDAINDNYQFLANSPIRTPVDPPTTASTSRATARSSSSSTSPNGWATATSCASSGTTPTPPQTGYSLQAIRAVIAARNTNWTNLFTQFASWNTLPAGSYSERAELPAVRC